MAESAQWIWGAGSALALLAATGANAQSAGQGAPGEPGSAAPGTVEEVIVTAQKREESLQDTPVAITALGGDQLASVGATQLEDYVAYVPGLSLASGGGPGQKQIILRGITSGEEAATTVGVYVDEVPFGSSSSYARASRFQLDLVPFDLERIEVLRGPQGTVYGASSLGGLLKYVTRQPDLDERQLGIQLDASAAAHGGTGYGVKAAAGAPLITDKLGVRLSGYHLKNPGYIDNDLLGRKNLNESTQEGLRGVLLWRPTPELSLRLQALSQDIEQDGQGTVDFATFSRLPLIGDDLTQSRAAAEPFEQQYRLYSATLDYDLKFATLTAVASTSDTDTFVVAQNRTFARLIDPAGALGAATTFPLRLGLDKDSYELRLTSAPNARFEWLLGGFHTEEDSANFQQILAFVPGVGPVPGFNPGAEVELPTTYEESAVFANGTYHITPEFDVGFGARYARNEQTFSQTNRGPLLGLRPGQTTVTTNDSEDDIVTYQVSPRWRPTEDLTLYGRFATGYRPGGPNIVIAGISIPQTFDSDTTKNYEIGVKAALADGRATFDLAAFYIDWKDIQIIQVVNGVSFRGNGEGAESKGFEGAATFIPMDDLTLTFNVAYTDSTLKGDAPGIGGADGDEVPYVADWNLSLVTDYAFDLTADLEGSVGFTARFVGDRPSTLSLNPNGYTLDEFATLDLRAGLRRDRISLNAFARNVGDARPAFSAASTGGITALSIAQPRTFGLMLTAEF